MKLRLPIVIGSALLACAGAILHCSSDDPPAAQQDAGKDTSTTIDSGGIVDSAPDNTSPADSGADAAVRSFIDVPGGDPASVYWDGAESALYIADNLNNKIWRWTEAGGLASFATTADPLGALDGGGTLVGQIQRLSDKTLVVMRFGKPGNPGGYGGIVFVRPDGGTDVVPNLSPNRKRLGLGVGPGDALYGSYFVGVPDSGGQQQGGVTRVDLGAGETEVAPGFKKIIGVLVVGSDVLVADQFGDAIYKLPLAALQSGAYADGGPDGGYTVLAALPRPDQICVGPNGSIFTGQFQAAPDSSAPLAVRQIAADGSVSVFAQDPLVTKPSGVAYDPVKRRLFVADSGNPAKKGVHVLPVP
jgi:sugar lactone lactonase YvrE